MKMCKNFVEKVKTQIGLYSLKVKKRGFYKLKRLKSAPLHAREALGKTEV